MPVKHRSRRPAITALFLLVALGFGAAAAGLPTTGTVEFDALDEANISPGPGDQSVGLGELVSLFNGNLFLSQESSPAVPVPDGAVARLARSYNSHNVRLYEIDVDGGGTESYLSGQGWAGLGWTVHLGRIFMPARYNPGGAFNYDRSAFYRYFESATGQRLRVTPFQSAFPHNIFVQWVSPIYDDCPGSSCVFDPAGICCNNSSGDPVPGFCDQPCTCGCPPAVLVSEGYYRAWMPDGTLLILDHEVQPDTTTDGWVKNLSRAGFYTTYMRDVHGRIIRIEYDENNANFPEAIKRVLYDPDPNVADDETELIVAEACAASDVPSRCPVEGMLKTVRASGFKGDNPSPLQVEYQYYYSTKSVTDATGTSNIPVLTKVELPEVDGTPAGEVLYSYGTDMSLEPGTGIYGPMLTRVSHPTGAVVEIKYGTWDAGSREVGSTTVDRSHVGVEKVTVFPDGLTATPSSAPRYSTTWTREFTLPDCDDPEENRASTFVTTAPDGRQVATEYNGHPCNDPAADWGAFGTVKSNVVYDTDGTSPFRTVEHGWDYETDPDTGEEIRAIRSFVETTYHDDEGTCFGAGGDGGGPRKMRVTNEDRNDWNQWRLSYVTGDYLPTNYRRLTYTNFHSPDNPVFSGCSTDDHIVGTFDERFVEEGIAGDSTKTQRFEETMEFDCLGRLTSTRMRPQWENKTTTLGQPVVANEASADGDLITSRVFGTGIYPESSQILIEGDLSTYGSDITWTYGQVDSIAPTGVTYDTTDLVFDESGLVKQSNDPNLLATKYSYDALGRLITVDPPGTTEHSTEYVFPSLNEVRTIAPPSSSDTWDPADPEQLYSATILDGMGRVAEEHRLMESGILSLRLTRYDQLGRVIFVSEWMNKNKYESSVGMTKITWTNNDGSYKVGGIPNKDGLPLGTITFYGVPSTAPGQEDNPLRATPDPLSRPHRTERADGEAVVANYCGVHAETRVLDVQTSIGGPGATATTRSYYDGLGRLVLVDAPPGSANAEYAYDARGNLTRVNLVGDFPADPFDAWLNGTIPGGQERTLQYDAVGRLESSYHPETGSTEVLVYDAAGNVLQWRDNQGAVRGYFFESVTDAAGRVIETRRVQGTPATPATADVELLGDSGDFDQATDLTLVETPGKWLEGTVSGGLFTAGESSWQQVTYGGCLEVPPGPANPGGLYLGASCSYKNVPAEPQAARFALDDVTRDDVLDFKFYRHVREGVGDKDEFSAVVVLQSAGNSVADARTLFQLDQSQSSYATWRAAKALRAGDLFSESEWPEEEGGVPATRDLFLYLIFTKGDAAQTGVGLGVMVDDVFVGRRATETIAEFHYDEDVCAGASPPEACSSGAEPENRYQGKLNRVSSYQGGQLVAEEALVFRGLNGRLSGLTTSVDWAGVGELASFESDYTYAALGQLATWAPAKQALDGERSYENHYRRGLLIGITSDTGRSFLDPEASPAAVEYSPAGHLESLRFANSTSQYFALDKMHRIDWINSTGPDVGGGTQTLWTTGGAGSYAYDGAGNITRIGGQSFAYDLAGRLTEANVLPQASDPSEADVYDVTYAYDPYGNQLSREWEKPAEPAAPEPVGMDLTQTFEDASGGNRNQILDSQFFYNLNGELTRMVAADVSSSASWTPTGQLSTFYTGQPELGAHRPIERYIYDATGLRVVRVPDGGDGRPVITIRDPAGNTQSEFVVNPADGEAQLTKDFIYGAGRLLVKRRVTWDAPSFQANIALMTGDDYTFDVVGQAGSGSYVVDIRTNTGFTNQVAVTPTGNRITLAESQFSLDEVNYVRVREVDGGESSPYSTPVTLFIDTSVTAQSANQVRAVSVSRVGTDILVSYGLLGQNTKATSIYFERSDTGEQILQTPIGLPPGTTSYTISEQSLAVVCGEMTTAHNGGFSAGAEIPVVHLAQNVSSDPEECDGDPPGVPEYAFLDYFHHRDHLGSLRVVTNDGGWEETSHDFYPFGYEMFDPATGPAGDTAQRYTVHERDSLTALDYMKARFKSMSAGTFLSPDPIFPRSVFRPSTWNRYSYVESNPMGLIDPYGLQSSGGCICYTDSNGDGVMEPVPCDCATSYADGYSGSNRELRYWARLAWGVSDRLERSARVLPFPGMMIHVGQREIPLEPAHTSCGVRMVFDLSDGTLTVDNGAQSYTLAASSGNPGECLNNPDCSHLQYTGPIPPGTYIVQSWELDNPSPIHDRIRNMVFGDWGDWRIRIYPSVGTNTRGRTDLFMHCGKNPGSAGCIDIGGGRSGNDSTDRLKTDLIESYTWTGCLEVVR